MKEEKRKLYPFIIKNNNNEYLTRTGGWSNDHEFAMGFMIKYMAEQMAKKVDGIVEER